MPADPDPIFSPGALLLNGKYRVERLLGQGAFGEVYLARHSHLAAPCALKVLRRSLVGDSQVYQEYIERFTLEARLGHSLSDEHIIKVFDFEPDGPGQAFILQMEYAAGGSLKTRLDANRQTGTRFEFGPALQLAAQAAAGLACLHRRDIVHRDLSPNNLLFDGAGCLKISDLGLAQVPGGPSMRSRASRAAPHPGTPGYMSPEQESSGAALRPAADIYTLGILLFEMLSGRSYPMLEPGTRLSSLRPDAPPALDDLLERMLAENWRERPFNGEKAGLLLQAELERIGRGPAAERARLAAEEKAGRDGEEKAALEKKQRETAEAARQEAEARARAAAEQAALEKKQREAALAARLAEEKARIEPEEMKLALARGVELILVRVPAGKFLMGAAESDKEAQPDERPQHSVHLEEYWIGKYPVTNAQFRAFLQAARYAYKEKLPEGRDNHPVVQVTWYDAVAFCAWAAKASGQKLRLPSEAEWEKAARGPDGRLYPWGNAFPDASRLNYNNNINDTTPVGNYPQGSSPYGALDMAGNVWEWVADWYGETYYASSPANNPTGLIGDLKILRGGSWYIGSWSFRASNRYGDTPDGRYFNYGFRCSR